MAVTVRTPVRADFGQMSDLLNAIIAAGGTTALAAPVDVAGLFHWMTEFSGRNAWQVAVDPAGQIIGFQYIEPHDRLAHDTADIATFVRIGSVNRGIGTLLFARTKPAAAGLGYRWLNATIRADNAGGLRYYARLGFDYYALAKGIALPDGTPVDRISKRFGLE